MISLASRERELVDKFQRNVATENIDCQQVHCVSGRRTRRIASLYASMQVELGDSRETDCVVSNFAEIRFDPLAR